MTPGGEPGPDRTRTDHGPERAGNGVSTGSVPRLPVTRRELVALILITLVAAVVRFAHVASGGPWDSDQGTELLAMWSAMTTGQLPLFGPAATSLGSTFHHGALYYDLLMPALLLSHGDPRAILAEIAAVNLLVVPMLWWIARSIGGRATGIIVALMAASSADLVFFSTFIWNPTFIETGATLGLLGTWQAWRTGDPRWWVAAAAGVTLAAQAHVAAAVLILPVGLVYLLDLRRASGLVRRRRILWGLAGLALLLATYLPVVIHELTGGFTELRGIASYVSSPPGYVEVSPLARLVFAAIRIPAWPLTGWPYFELRPGLVMTLAVFLALAAAWSMMLLRTWRHRLSISGFEVTRDDERHGFALMVGGVGLIVVVLGLGLRAVSELNVTMSEQYHTAADPFVLVATAVTIGAIWNAGRRAPAGDGPEASSAAAGTGAGAGSPRSATPDRVAFAIRRALAIAVVVAFVVFNAAHWRPVTTAGSWTDAQAAATRLERDAAGGRIALVPLYATKGTDAYAYPLLRDGIGVVAPEEASTVVLLCDSTWIKVGCGGYEEKDWLGEGSQGRGLTLIDYFDAAPDKVMSVYKRNP
jgi:4-amino-4-deoxy-L-arabinose transferase-like glycosyltransferase